MRFTLLLAMTIFCGVQSAQADIIFVNLNLQHKEELAARKAAEIRHEKIIVIPELTPAEWKQVEIDGGYSLASSKHLDIAAAIDSALASEDKSHAAVTSFILSSHHVNHYFGTMGSIDDLKLFSVLKKHPSTRNHLVGMYGWGCYTAEADNALELSRNLPVAILAGWDGAAPSEGRLADTEILTYMLTHQNQAIVAQLKNKLDQFFKTVPYVNTTNFGLVACGQLRSTHSSFNIHDPAALCTKSALHGADDHGFGGLFNRLRTYESYMASRNVPEDLNNSDLRQFYNMARTYAVCSEVRSAIAEGTFPTNSQIVHLIHFKNSAKNFVSLYRSDLERLQALQRKWKATTNFDIDITAIDWNKGAIKGEQLFSLLEAASGIATKMEVEKRRHPPKKSLADQAIELATGKKKAETRSPDQLFLDRIYRNLNVLLGQNKCVPDQWDDPPGARIAVPDEHCLQRTRLVSLDN